MATSDLYGWFPTMSQPLTAPPQDMWTTPERAPGALIGDRTGGLLDFGMGPLSQQAYQMAGSPKRGPNAGVMMPYSNYPDDSGDASASGGGALSLLQDANQANKLYSKLNGSTTGDPAIQQPSQLNELGSKLGLTSGLSPGWASGANLNNAALGQIGYPSALGFDAGGLATGYAPAAILGSSLAGIGSGAAANAALAEAGFLGGWATPSVEATLAGASGAGAGSGAAAGAAGASGATGASGGLLASSGLTTALPIAAVGFALADYLNSGPLNDDKSKDRNIAAYSAYTGARPVQLTLGRTAKFYYAMPDGTLVNSDDFNNLAGSWYGATYAPDGNQADWQAKYDQFSKSLQPATLPKGYVWDAAAGKIVRG